MNEPSPTSWTPLALGGTTTAGEKGFAWGYLDIIDPAHNGIVVIWSFGLPFMPGTMGAGRNGAPIDALKEPSLSIAVHRRGLPDLWLLQRQQTVCPHPDPFQPGLRFDGCSIQATEEGIQVKIDCPIPGGPRLQGTVQVRGARLTLPDGGPGPHRWTPRLLGTGTAELSCGDWRFGMEGSGYHDSNASSIGLDRLGIRRWIWGRTPHPGGTWIHYLVEPTDPSVPNKNLWLEIDPAGNVRCSTVDADQDSAVRGRWGLPSPRCFRIAGFEVQHLTALEDGPYYQRWLTEVRAPDGSVHRGTGEFVDVTRMDAGLLGWLTGFAVHDPQHFSWWAPLFCGPTQDRWSRLWKHWIS